MKNIVKQQDLRINELENKLYESSLDNDENLNYYY